MKTKLKITLAAVLILLMSSGVAMALSMDYTIDFGNSKRSYKYFNDKKLNSFNFDVDLDNVIIKSVTLTIKQMNNWNRKKKEIWGLSIGDDFYRLNTSKNKWKTLSLDITDSFNLGSPLSMDLLQLRNRYSNIHMDWITLTVNYDEIADIVGGSETGNGGSPAPVPEPGTLVLLGAGLLVAARFGFRRLK